MSAIQQLMVSFGAIDAPRKITTSADMGATVILNRGADMTGVGDSATGILSVWFRLDGSNGSVRKLLANTSQYVDIGLLADNKMKMDLVSPTAGNLISITSTSTYVAGAAWHHLLASWDMAGLAGQKPKHMYINNNVEQGAVSDVGGVSIVEYTRGEWQVGSLGATGSNFDGCLAEFWFAPGQFLDFSVASNRNKFRNGAGQPIDLGVNGELPTGTAPALYLSNEFSTFPTNNGTGGDFIVSQGALTAGSSAP